VALLDSINAIRQWLVQLEREVRELQTPSSQSDAQTSPESQDQGDNTQIAWGAKVSSTFKDRVVWIADSLGCSADDLMACMAWESAETFRSDIKNAAGSGATGLIQFMPKTAIGLGTTVELLAKMSPEDQLKYVYFYFKPWAGKLHNLGDVYMTILWPAAVGNDDRFVLFDRKKTPTTFRQNAGLDVNKDGLVTRGECLIKVNEKLQKGLKLKG
jgi:hypothetical protein